MLGWALGLLAAGLLPGCTPSIHDQVARGEAAAVRARLEADPALVHARTSDLEKTPLHYAVGYKQRDIMAILAEAGADLDAADHTGLTPLHVAAMFGRKDEAAWLIENGARLDKADRFGDTPLHTAAMFGHGHIVALLHAHGAALALPNGDGRTPLELARMHRRTRVAALLERLAAS